VPDEPARKYGRLRVDELGATDVWATDPRLSFLAVMKVALEDTTGDVLLLVDSQRVVEAFRKLQHQLPESLGVSRRVTTVQIGSLEKEQRFECGPRDEELFFDTWGPEAQGTIEELKAQDFGVVLFDFLPYQARGEMFRKWVDSPGGRADWVVVHDAERLLKGDMLRLPEDLEGRCYEEHWPSRPWPVLAGPSTLLASGHSHTSCILKPNPDP